MMGTRYKSRFLYLFSFRSCFAAFFSAFFSWWLCFVLAPPSKISHQIEQKIPALLTFGFGRVLAEGAAAPLGAKFGFCAGMYVDFKI